MAVTLLPDVEPLAVVAARLERHRWKQDAKGFDGLGRWEHGARGLGLIHSVAVEEDGELWEHMSVSRDDGTLPTWDQTRHTFREVCGPLAHGIIVVAPKPEHVSIAEVMHVFRCLTRRPVPDFTRGTRTI